MSQLTDSQHETKLTKLAYRHARYRPLIIIQHLLNSNRQLTPFGLTRHQVNVKLPARKGPECLAQQLTVTLTTLLYMS